MINKHFVGEQIQKLRKEKKWSQDYLAEQLSKKRQTIASWEDGRITFDVGTMIEICNLFDCDMGYLLGYHKTRRYTTPDIQKETGLSEKAIEHLISGKRSCNENEITKIAWFLNILLENCGVNLLASDVRSYYESLERSRIIEQSPDCDWLEYATVSDVRNLIDRPFTIPKLDGAGLTQEQRKEVNEWTKAKVNSVEFKEFLAKHDKKKREEALLRETQERQAMFLWHIQKIFLQIVEEGASDYD